MIRAIKSKSSFSPLIFQNRLTLTRNFSDKPIFSEVFFFRSVTLRNIPIFQADCNPVSTLYNLQVMCLIAYIYAFQSSFYLSIICYIIDR